MIATEQGFYFMDFMPSMSCRVHPYANLNSYPASVPSVWNKEQSFAAAEYRIRSPFSLEASSEALVVSTLVGSELMRSQVPVNAYDEFASQIDNGAFLSLFDPNTICERLLRRRTKFERFYIIVDAYEIFCATCNVYRFYT
jgi:hypothetical protein